jgi:hypothetical protein
MNDSGEVGITDGVSVPIDEKDNTRYYNNTILFYYNACPMAGLSVENDKNLTSTGDIVWTNNQTKPIDGVGNKKTLTAGNTYVYFGYKNSDLGSSSGGGTTTCSHTSKSYTSLGNRQHTVKCNSCGTSWTEACTSDGGGSCKYCIGPY